MFCLLVVAVSGILVHGDVDLVAHHLVEVMDGVLHVVGDGEIGELLEIEQAGIAPPYGIAGLDAQFPLHLVEALCVHIRLHVVPDCQELPRLMHALVVFVAQLIPERTSALHLMVP